MSARRYWIGVAAADHIARGVAGSFMQVNHGKLAPLKRMTPGDVIAYYSPVEAYGGDEKLQAFTAIGVVKEGDPYEGEMGSFKAFRRDVAWREANPCAHPAAASENCPSRAARKAGVHKFRLGFFRNRRSDMQLIAKAMGCDL